MMLANALESVTKISPPQIIVTPLLKNPRADTTASRKSSLRNPDHTFKIVSYIGSSAIVHRFLTDHSYVTDG